MYRRRSLACLALSFVAGCVPRPATAPPSTPVSAPRIVPAPAPPRPASASADWRDWPLTPGDWIYHQDARGSIARFGIAGQAAQMTLRCDKARARLYLSRAGTAAAMITIRTTGAVRMVQAVPIGGTPPYIASEFGARDPLLDAIGFSRGRFLVEGGGVRLIVPAWPEILRVIEDCRA